MKIQQLNIRNFKGLGEVEIIFNGKDMEIYGDNETGKTRINDAYAWVMSGRNSSNSAKFGIKPWDADGNPTSGIECEVEIIFMEPSIKLRKVYKEIWKKVEGNANEIYDGNTIDYFVDDVPKTQKLFIEQINELCGSVELFAMMSNAANFPSNAFIKWEKRREILFEIGGNLTDEQIFEMDPELQELKTAMGKRKMDDLKDMLKAANKKINDEIEKIPARISENQRTLNEMPDINIPAMRAVRDKLNQLMHEEQDNLLILTNGGNKAMVKHEIDNMNKTISLNTALITRLKQERIKTIQKDHDSIIREIEHQCKRESEMSAQIQNYQAIIEGFKAECNDLRSRFKSISCQQPSGIDDIQVCPLCAQELPEISRKAIRENMLANWNQSTSKMLEEINAEGKEKQRLIENNYDAIKNVQEQLETIEKLIFALRATEEKLTEEKAEESESQEMLRLKEEIVELEIKRQLAEKQFNAEPEDETFKLQIEKATTIIKALEQDIETTNKDISTADTMTKAKERIEELTQNNITLGHEHTKNSRVLYLIDKFIRTKVESVSKQINDKFKFVNWKLFKTNENGNIEECCEAMYKGVPWNADLNTAAKVNAGMDIIQTLQEHYQKDIPVFVDNGESVTKLLEIPHQIIKLSVRPDEPLNWRWIER